MMRRDLVALILKISLVFNLIEVTASIFCIIYYLSSLLTAVVQVLGWMDAHLTSSIKGLTCSATMRMVKILSGKKLEPLGQSSWMELFEVAWRTLSSMHTIWVITALRRLIGGYINIVSETE
jgi:hypothetical protein